MAIDHLGFVLDVPVMRVVGRLAMPMYAFLFCLSLRSGRGRLFRLFLISVVSQYPYYLLFGSDSLNIIFGFLFFAMMVRGWLFWGVALAVVFPVDYGIYLYAVLVSFYFGSRCGWFRPRLVHAQRRCRGGGGCQPVAGKFAACPYGLAAPIG